MSPKVDSVIAENPNERTIVIHERALVSLNNAASDVQAKTTFPFPPTQIPPDPPTISTSCAKARTWTFSGQHETGANGKVTIDFSKFLRCVSSAIEGAFNSNYIGLLHFVATPQTARPCFLSFTVIANAINPPPGQTFLGQDALDVVVTVETWNQDGTSAPSTTFNWIANAKLVSLTNF
jgi:hypothetical protein